MEEVKYCSISPGQTWLIFAVPCFLLIALPVHPRTCPDSDDKSHGRPRTSMAMRNCPYGSFSFMNKCFPCLSSRTKFHISGCTTDHLASSVKFFCPSFTNRDSSLISFWWSLVRSLFFFFTCSSSDSKMWTEWRFTLLYGSSSEEQSFRIRKSALGSEWVHRAALWPQMVP